MLTGDYWITVFILGNQVPKHSVGQELAGVINYIATQVPDFNEAEWRKYASVY